jgi:histidine triad (HIT) family protein
MSAKNIFQKIIDGEIAAQIVHDDDRCLAFRDINPQAPTHLLVIPKIPIRNLDEAGDDDQQLLGHLLLVVRDLAHKFQLDGGYRLVMNCRHDGGQTVDHLHFHLLGGRPMKWPPG